MFDFRVHRRTNSSFYIKTPTSPEFNWCLCFWGKGVSLLVFQPSGWHRDSTSQTGNSAAPCGIPSGSPGRCTWPGAAPASPPLPTACQQQHSICVWECVLCGLALTGCQWWESFVFFRYSHTSSITCRDIQQQRLSAAPKGKIKQLHVYKNLLYPQSDWYLCCYYINSSLICSYMCGVGVFIWQHTQKLATNELIIQVKLVVMIL